MIFDRALDLETRIDARPETVFAFLTDPEKYRLWQGLSAELDPRPGGTWRVRFTEHTTASGEYVVVDPPHRLVFTWGWESDVDLPPGLGQVRPGSSTVELTLDRDGDATLLRLRHTGLPEELSVRAHAWGWQLYVPRLETSAAGGDPGPDPLSELLPMVRTLAAEGRAPW